MNSLLSRCLLLLASILRVRHIRREDGVPYLDRHRVIGGFMPGSPSRLPFGIYLHHILTADYDEAPHNHPWPWAVSVILSGSYDEERPGQVTRRVRWFNVIRHGSFHRISELHGDVWTLFVVDPRASSWGFLVPSQGFVEWRQRLAERGIKADH